MPGLARDPVGQVRYPARMIRRPPPREAGDREIQSAPEQVNGTGLTEKGSSEPVVYPVDGHQGLVVALHGFLIIGPVAVIRAERDGVGDLVRRVAEGRCAAEVGNQLHELRAERRDGGRLERERRLATVAAGAEDPMVVKVEQNLCARAVGDRRGGQASDASVRAAWTSSVISTASLTRTPPVSRTVFQFRP